MESTLWEHVAQATGLWDLLYGEGLAQLIAPFAILAALFALAIMAIPLIVGYLRGWTLRGAVGSLCALLATAVTLETEWMDGATSFPMVVVTVWTLWLLREPARRPAAGDAR